VIKGHQRDGDGVADVKSLYNIVDEDYIPKGDWRCVYQYMF